MGKPPITEEHVLIVPRPHSSLDSIFNLKIPKISWKFAVLVCEEKLREILKSEAGFVAHLSKPERKTGEISYRITGDVVLILLKTEELKKRADKDPVCRSDLRHLQNYSKIDTSDNPRILNISSFFPRKNLEIKKRFDELTKHKGIGAAALVRIIELAKLLKADYVTMTTNKRWAQETCLKCGLKPVGHGFQLKLR